jgi:hypothetical protein
MVADQAESELIALLRPHYGRIDHEGRTLLHQLFAAAGDIRVSNSELLSSPHRALAARGSVQHPQCRQRRHSAREAVAI